MSESFEQAQSKRQQRAKAADFLVRGMICGAFCLGLAAMMLLEYGRGGKGSHSDLGWFGMVIFAGAAVFFFARAIDRA